MSAREEQVRALIAQDAADWFVASRPGLTADERKRLVTWLKVSPVHVEEYLALEAIGRDLRRACEASESSIDELVARARREDDTPTRPFWRRLLESLRTSSPRRQAAAIAMAALAVVSLGLLALWNLRPNAPISTPVAFTTSHFETRHGEQQTHRLADNSVLHLNTDSAVTIRYSRSERLVTLTAGEAAFEVVHEPERAFRVLAGPAEVMDLGTRFDVRLEHDAVLVTVVEGRVAVRPSLTSEKPGTHSDKSQPPRFVELGAQQQLRLIAGEWPPTVSAVDPQRPTAWLRRQIVFEYEPLERVASEFNRYAQKPIEITTPALRNLQISGVFATDDTEAFVAFLRKLKGVQVEVTPTQIRVSQE